MAPKSGSKGGGKVTGQTLTGTTGNDILLGASGDDVFDALSGDDLLTGGDGNDTFIFSSGYGNDVITDFQAGKRTDDTIVLRDSGISGFSDLQSHLTYVNGDTVITLDSGDTLTLQGVSPDQLAASDFAFESTSGTDSGSTTSGTTVRGGRRNDILVGTDGDDTILAKGGNDQLTGAGGNDTLDGGDGTDIAIFSGALADYSFGYNDTGNLVVTDTRGIDGEDVLVSVETLRFSDGDVAIADVPLTVTGGDAADVLSGGANDDVIDGGAGGDILNGGDGNDTLIGGDGDDYVDGGTGDDILVGGTGRGNDVYIGGEGSDTLKYSSADENHGLTINLAEGYAVDKDASNPWIDSDTISGVENVIGGDGGDTIIGDDNANVITGGRGANDIDGRGGNDQLLGNNSDDRLKGGAGNDQLFGNNGTDTAVFSGAFAEYDFVFNVNGTLTVIHARGDQSDGTDILHDIERLEFSDRTVSTDGTFNQFPNAVTATLVTAEDTAVSGTLDATDPDGDAITFGLVDGPANGSLSINADGTYTYTPNADYAGGDSFTYSVTDSFGNVTEQTVQVTLDAVADAPILTVSTEAAVYDPGVAPVYADGDGWQSNPSSATLVGGGSVVVFSSSVSGSGAVIARILDDTGTPVGPEIEIARESVWQGSSIGAPAVVGMPDGGFAVSWTERNTAVDEYSHPRYALFDATGEKTIGPFNLDTLTHSTAALNPDITMLSDNSFVVTWMTDAYDSPENVGIAVRHINADGVPVGGQETIVLEDPNPSSYYNPNSGTTHYTSNYGAPTITGTSDGGYLLALKDDTTLSQGSTSNGSILVSKYSADGALEFTNQTVLPAPLSVRSDSLNMVKAFALDDGGYVIAWDEGDEAGALTVMAQTLDAEGNVVTDPFVVHSEVLVGGEGDGYSRSPDLLAKLADGTFVAVRPTNFKYDNDTSSPTNEIVVQRFDAFGNLLGEPTVVFQHADVFVIDVVVGALESGGFQVTWGILPYEGSGALLTSYDIYDVYGRSFDANGVASGPAQIINEKIIVDGMEGTEASTIFALNVDAALTDLDGSEALSVLISGVPDGATLSAGTDNGDGTWNLDAADLGGLSLSMPGYVTDAPVLTISATATEGSNGDAKTVTTVLTLSSDDNAIASQTITGSNGDDTLQGGLGNDTLSGGAGDDIFVFADGDGYDIVTDFQAGAGTEDALDLRDVTTLNTFSEVMAVALDVGDDVVIQISADQTITLAHVQSHMLHEDDFIF